MNDGKLTWRVLGRRRLLHTRVFDVMAQEERSASGIQGEYYVLDGPDCVVTVAVTEGRFVLVRQWRHGAQAIVTEFPGGVVDAGEDPQAAASRELYEETGYIAGRMTHIGSCSPNPAIFSSTYHVYLAEELTATGEQHLDRDESIEVLTRPIPEVIAGFGTGEYTQGFMGAAISFYLKHLMKEGN